MSLEFPVCAPVCHILLKHFDWPKGNGIGTGQERGSEGGLAIAGSYGHELVLCCAVLRCTWVTEPLSVGHGETALDWGATYFHSCLLAAAECFAYRFSFDVLQGIEEAAFHRLLSTVEGGKGGWYMVCQNGNKEIKCICREREKECFQLKISM